MAVAGARARSRATPRTCRLSVLLDTHFLLWTVLGAKRLAEFPWLDRYRPWRVSPVSFLEIQFLTEIGRISARGPEFLAAVMEDSRFVVDEVPLLGLVRHALSLAWTRDPFDRLLAAHSLTRRLPLCTTDRLIRKHHGFVPAELGRP
jgi:PIN domain nuclease of toxin-antitoxin system